MTTELYDLFLTMAIIGSVTGILGFLSERYESSKYGRVLMSLTIMSGLIMLYMMYRTFEAWSLM
ncbi:hypothetical protein OAD15_04165 [Hyphomicrobiales bacterium]|nr:hypothetical protein [Hyphomicrobiales bacterium]